jgi:type II secretion system protein G
MFHHTRKGFTLIELLIVVAIIGILAAIAVPNFLEAQVRAKVAKAVSEMRTVMIAAETYNVDNDAYPPCYGALCNGCWIQPPMFRLVCLSTPVEYLSTIPFLDPFGLYNEIGYPGIPSDRPWFSHYEWRNNDQFTAVGDGDGGFSMALGIMNGHPSCWMESRGPDMEFWMFGMWAPRNLSVREAMSDYDSSNGTISWGDIRRFSSGQTKLIPVTVGGETFP